MPWIDHERGLLVIRIVYDGPAMSGKTTSMQALARGVSRDVECPEEADGRTVYFDWLEYVGGLFEGRQICCQIVSVPGQRELDHRRQLLLSGADAVVCVLDTRRDELEFSLSWLGALLPDCRAKQPPVGVVLQANKRDAADAVNRDQLRESLSRIAPLALVESVATSADGIREAFVLAVRLALDRVRALTSQGQLGSEASELTAAALLTAMHDAEAPAAAPVIEQVVALPELTELQLPRAAAQEQSFDSASEEQLFVPDPSMPGGMIWPPVDGRTLLHEVSALGIRPARTARGDWWGTGAGWRFHSAPWSLYSDPSAARDRLLQWARLHSVSAGRISTGRAVILADAGCGRLRLWQLVRVEATLRERLDQLLSEADPRVVAAGLHEVSAQLLIAREWFAQAGTGLRCSLWTVCASSSSRPVFVGLMPDPDQRADTAPSAAELLKRELVPQLRELRRTRLDYGAVRREVTAIAGRHPHDQHAQTFAQVVAAAS